MLKICCGLRMQSSILSFEDFMVVSDYMLLEKKISIIFIFIRHFYKVKACKEPMFFWLKSVSSKECVLLFARQFSL